MVETGHYGAINSLAGEEEFSRVHKAFFFYNHSSCQPNISSCVAIPPPSSPRHFLLPWQGDGGGREV